MFFGVSFTAFVLALILAETRKFKFTFISMNFTSLENTLVVLLRRCIGVLTVDRDCATSVLVKAIFH